jgi:hypothetical protein
MRNSKRIIKQRVRKGQGQTEANETIRMLKLIKMDRYNRCKMKKEKIKYLE